MFNKKEYERIKLEIPLYVKILAAVKTRSVDEIKEAINSGIKIIGENYVQEAEEKYENIKNLLREKDISFHLIGHLQSNKIKKAVKIFDCIETLDSEELAEKINNVCKKKGKKINVMIEINFDEPKKQGVQIPDLDSLIQKINSLSNLCLIGFMCIPPIGKKESCFAQMKELKEKYKIKELSMGMSSDYKTAIKYGTTIIRLGTILFGKRE